MDRRKEVFSVEWFLIGELVRRAGVNKETVRYYESIWLEISGSEGAKEVLGQFLSGPPKLLGE